MELRLILDGGAPPGAPPGKIESSPGENQFEVELTSEAQKLAIVEEMGCEPNVPPTNLDPESENKETPLTDALSANSPLSIMIGQMILGRPEPARIQNSVPNKQIAAATIDGNLTVYVKTPVGNRDAKLETPVTLLPNPEMAAKIEEWAKQFASKSTTIEGTPATDATLTGGTEPKFNPEHLEALNVVYMSKREIFGEAPAVTNPLVNAVVQPEENVAPKTETESATIANQMQTTDPTVLAVVNSASTEARVVKPNLVEHAEIVTEGVTEDALVTSNVVATAKESTGSTLTDGDSEFSETSDKETPKEPELIDASTATKPHSTIDKAVVSTQSNTERQTMSLEDRQRNIDLITKKIETLAANSVRNEIRVEMHPPDMGSVSINVKQAIDSLSVTLSASNDRVQEALHESRNDLATTLQVRAKQEVNIEIKAGQSQSLPQEQANAHHQRNPQREQSEALPQFFGAPEREQKQPTPQAPRVRPNTFINLEI